MLTPEELAEIEAEVTHYEQKRAACCGAPTQVVPYPEVMLQNPKLRAHAERKRMASAQLLTSQGLESRSAVARRAQLKQGFE